MQRAVEVLRQVTVVLSVALAACGGDDSAPGGAGTDTSGAFVRVTFSPSELVAYRRAGEAPAYYRVKVTLDPLPVDAAFVQVTDPDGVVDTDTLEVEANPDGSYFAYVGIPGEAAPGTYEGALLLKLCRDGACADEIPLVGSSLPYRVTITPQATTTATAVIRVNGIAQDLASTLDATGARHYAVTVRSGAKLEVSVPYDPVVWSYASGFTSATVERDPASSRRTFIATLRLTNPDADAETTRISALAEDGQLIQADVTVTR